MRLILRDIEPEMVLAWTRQFGDYKGVSFGSGSILDGRLDAVVSPANSYGYMDGGIDLIYRNFFGLQIENRVRKVIEDRYEGKLPVGSAFLVPT